MVEQTPDDLLWAWYMTFGTRKVTAPEIITYPSVGGFPSPFWDELITKRKLMAIDTSQLYPQDNAWHITEAGIMHLQQDSGSV